MACISKCTSLLPALLMAGMLSTIVVVWSRRYQHHTLGSIPSKSVSAYGQPVALIANGSTASVLHYWDSTSDEHFAVKHFKNDARIASAIADSNQVMREAVVVAQLSPHPSILKMRDFIQESGNWYAVMPYIPTTLFDRIMGRGEGLSLGDKICIWVRIVDGIRHMHSEHVAHLDLKLNNVVLENGFWPKIIDFGASEIDWTGAGRENWIIGRRGTPPFAPPEAYVKTLYDAYAADIWALAMIWCQMLLPTVPWKNTNDEHGPETFRFFESADSDVIVQQRPTDIAVHIGMLTDDKRQQAWTDSIRANVVMISNHITLKESRGVLQRMLEFEARKRPTATELMQHPWVKRQVKLCGDFTG